MEPQADRMKNYGPEARRKFVERAEARRAEHTEGPRSFKQFSDERSGVREVVVDDAPKYIYQDSPSDTPENIREARLLKKFGIKTDEAKKSLTGYRKVASEKPLKNILRKAPFELEKVALSLLARKGIDDKKGAEMVVRAEGNAISPKHFWELLDKYATTSREKRLQVPKGGPGFAKRVAAIAGTQTKKLEGKG